MPNVSTVSSESDGTRDLPSRYIYTRHDTPGIVFVHFLFLLFLGVEEFLGKTHNKQQQQREVDRVNVSTKQKKTIEQLSRRISGKTHKTSNKNNNQKLMVLMFQQKQRLPAS